MWLNVYEILAERWLFSFRQVNRLSMLLQENNDLPRYLHPCLPELEDQSCRYRVRSEILAADFGKLLNCFFVVGIYIHHLFSLNFRVLFSAFCGPEVFSKCRWCHCLLVVCFEFLHVSELDYWPLFSPKNFHLDILGIWRLSLILLSCFELKIRNSSMFS